MTDTTNSFRAFSAGFLSDPRVAPFRAVFDSYNLPYYLAVRAAELQVKWAPTLQGMADEQHWRQFQPPVWRGPIVDRNGAALALTVDVDSVFANPRELDDPDIAAVGLARALGLDVRTLAVRLRSKSRFVWIKRLVTPTEAEAVRRLGLDGVQTTREPKRFYPGRNLAAHLIGFVGYDSRGLDGLEHEYDAALRSEPRVWRGVRDARGRMVFTDGLGRVETAQDQRVELSIDRTIQYIAEQELAAALAALTAVPRHSYAWFALHRATWNSPSHGLVLARNARWLPFGLQWAEWALSEVLLPGADPEWILDLQRRATLLAPLSTSVALDASFAALCLGHRADAEAAFAALGGGLITTMVMVLASAPVARFALTFSSPEYFAIIIFGLTSVVSLGGGSITNAAISLMLGLLIATVGVDSIYGAERFAFGEAELKPLRAGEALPWRLV